MTRKTDRDRIPAPGPAAAGCPKVRTATRPDGRVAVDALPGVRVSNPNFLTEEFERFERERQDMEGRPAGIPGP